MRVVGGGERGYSGEEEGRGVKPEFNKDFKKESTEVDLIIKRFRGLKSWFRLVLS